MAQISFIIPPDKVAEATAAFEFSNPIPTNEVDANGNPIVYTSLGWYREWHMRQLRRFHLIHRKHLAQQAATSGLAEDNTIIT